MGGIGSIFEAEQLKLPPWVQGWITGWYGPDFTKIDIEVVAREILVRADQFEAHAQGLRQMAKALQAGQPG